MSAELGRAIVNKLREDTGPSGLVTLTGHEVLDPDGYRILTGEPLRTAIYPYLSIVIFQTERAIENGPSQLKKSRIHFRAFAKDDFVCQDICDRVAHLLDQDDQNQEGPLTNRAFLDFSSRSISNKQTQYAEQDVEPIFYDEDDTFRSQVECDVWWVNQICDTL